MRSKGECAAKQGQEKSPGSDFHCELCKEAKNTFPVKFSPADEADDKVSLRQDFSITRCHNLYLQYLLSSC